MTVIPVTASKYTSEYPPFKNMARPFKLVSAALAILLLTMPAAALASCTFGMRAMEKHTLQCAMMSTHMPPVGIQGSHAGPFCCQMSTGKLPLASVPLPRSNSAGRETPGLVVAKLQIPSITVTAEPAELRARPSRSVPQAFLCIFLI
jgi:hypothetical protein